MSVVMENCQHLTLLLEGAELRIIHVEQESNCVRLVLEHITHAEELAATLQAAADLGMAVVLPPLRLVGSHA